MSDVFRPDCYGGFRFDDPLIGVKWPASPEVISQRDLEFGLLNSEEFTSVFSLGVVDESETQTASSQ